MPWLVAAAEAGKIIKRVTTRWVYQYAKVDSAFLVEFPKPWAITTVKADVEIGDEVVRRVAQRVTAFAWPGLTYDAALAKANELYVLPQYGAIEMEHGGAGQYYLTAEETVYGVAGWSPWIRVSDFLEWSGVPA